MRREQLGINTVSLRGDYEEMMDACAVAGFRYVEFCLPQVKEYLKNGNSVADAKHVLESRGLLCIGGFEGGVQVVAGQAQAGNLDIIVENARLLSELGENSTLVVGCDCNIALSELPEAAGTLAKVFGNTAREIEPLGVTLAIEFNWGPIKSLPLAAEIARRSEQANLGVLFDPAHYHCTPTKLEDINAQNVPFIKHVHVNDMNGKPAEISNCNSDRALPGAGMLDLPAIFGAIEQHGYNGYFSIEMFSDKLWALPASEAAQQMYRSLLPLLVAASPSK